MISIFKAMAVYFRMIIQIDCAANCKEVIFPKPFFKMQCIYSFNPISIIVIKLEIHLITFNGKIKLISTMLFCPCTKLTLIAFERLVRSKLTQIALLNEIKRFRIKH